MQGAGHHDSSAAGGELAQDAVVHDRRELVRRARQREQQLFAQLDPQPGRAADRVVERTSTPGDVGLPQDGSGQVGVAVRPEALDERGLQRSVAVERDTGDGGDGVAGQVVDRRAEPAGQQHDVGVLERPPDGGDDPADVVADHRGVHDRSPDGGQVGAEPGGVAVDDVAEQQLVADRDHGRPHGRARCRFMSARGEVVRRTTAL